MSSKQQRYMASRSKGCSLSISQGTPEWTARFRDIRAMLSKASFQLGELANDVDDTKADSQIKQAEGLVDQARAILFRLQ